MARVECVKILHECGGNPDLHVQQLWKPKHVKFYSDDGRILSQLTSEEEEAPFFLELFGWTVKVALIDNYILTTDPNTSMPQDMAHQIQVSVVHRLSAARTLIKLGVSPGTRENSRSRFTARNGLLLQASQRQPSRTAPLAVPLS